MEFTLQPQPLKMDSVQAPITGASLKNLKNLQIGAGSAQLNADASGIWLGADNFADAKFSANMKGDVIANSIKINGLDGGVLANTISNAGQLITSNLNTQTKQILGEFTFADSGALAIKTDADNGLWISPAGILGKKSGNTSFAIDSAGNATFSGNVLASTITGGTITGANIQTAASGQRVILNGTNVGFYVDGTLKGSITPDAYQSMVYRSADNHYFFKNDGTYLATINEDGINLAGGNNFISNGSVGVTPGRKDFVTSINYSSSGMLRFKTRGITFQGGICIEMTTEEGWYDIHQF